MCFIHMYIDGAQPNNKGPLLTQVNVVMSFNP